MEVLSKNVALNLLQNVRRIQAAISDHRSETEFFQHADPSRSSMTRDGETTGIIRVQVVTLDSLLADRDRPVALMKIDVEGHEASVIGGATRILEQDRPIVLFEHLPGLGSASGQGSGAPIAMLRDLQYEIREFHRGTWFDVAGMQHQAKNLWAFPRPATDSQAAPHE